MVNKTKKFSNKYSIIKYLAPLNQSIIISFPSSIEYHEWCEKFCSLLSTKSPQTHHLHAPYTPQQVSRVILKKKLVFFLK
jgi:hypothetical protein